MDLSNLIAPCAIAYKAGKVIDITEFTGQNQKSELASSQ